MPQSLAKVLVHLIYSTKDRERWLTDAVREELHRYTATVFQSLQSPALLINSVEDHTHIIFNLARTRAISEVVETVKTTTSKWLKGKSPRFAQYHWQGGYGAFSVSQSQLGHVLDYVANQREHHQVKTFQEEFREFCLRHEVDLDEQYVWD